MLGTTPPPRPTWATLTGVTVHPVPSVEPRFSADHVRALVEGSGNCERWRAGPGCRFQVASLNGTIHNLILRTDETDAALMRAASA
eukprot:1739335-Rhodomonas_salina.1